MEESRIASHDIYVEETLYGKVPTHFPLLRDDVAYYQYNDLTILKEGDRVLMFIAIRPGNPDFARSYDTFYTTSDNGLFDIEGNHAYPRMPYAFEETKEPYYHQTGDPLQPFFELDQLKETIRQTG